MRRNLLRNIRRKITCERDIGGVLAPLRQEHRQRSCGLEMQPGRKDSRLQKSPCKVIKSRHLLALLIQFVEIVQATRCKWSSIGVSLDFGNSCMQSFSDSTSRLEHSQEYDLQKVRVSCIKILRASNAAWHGHSSIKVTLEVYVHVLPKADSVLADGLEKMFA